MSTFSFALLDRPAGLTHPTGVLLLPPFGWDEVCSYRPRREWSRALAAAGHPVMRVELPGTGNAAGSPHDPGLVDAWREAVQGSAERLRFEVGATRVAAIGLGLGGLLACLADGIDELVLWGVPGRGKTLVRELRAFARLEATQYSMPPLAEGVLQAAGYVLSAETRSALEAIELAPGAATASRALVLDRDGVKPDATLLAYLEGTETEVAPGRGWSEMLAEPQHARPPWAVIERVTTWLGEPPAARGEVEHVDPPSTVRHEGLFGVLEESADASDVCALFLNAGAQRHTGPNRMWVEAARRWAALGVPSLRVDLEGLGESDGDPSPYAEVEALYVPGLVAQVGTLLDVLEERGLGPRFVLVGLCAGAYWSFHTARQDPRVSAALMLNPRALIWDPEIERERAVRKAGRSLRSGAKWKKLLRGGVEREHIVGHVRALARSARAGQRDELDVGDELRHALATLDARGVELLLAFSHDEPLREELEGTPGLHFEELPGNVHTLRPLAAQARAHELLDAALELIVDRAPSVEDGDRARSRVEAPVRHSRNA